MLVWLRYRSLETDSPKNAIRYHIVTGFPGTRKDVLRPHFERTDGAFMNRKLRSIDVIVPCFNEEEVIGELIVELERIMSQPGWQHHLIFIDDGSTDRTHEELLRIAETKNSMSVIKFTRNFGKEAAIAAGLKYSKGDAVVIIDSDLQHPPHLIPAMVAEWEQGAQVVDAVKIRRQPEGTLRRLMAHGFNTLMPMLTGMDFRGAADYKLLDKKAVRILNSMQEKSRFFRGLTNWIGMTHRKIEFVVEERRVGKTKWSGLALVRLSLDAIMSYTSKPLHIVTILGVASLVFSVILGLQTLYNKFFGGAVSGFTTVILATLIMSSFIMIGLGIVGMYLSKIYDEVKDRPLYVIDEISAQQRHKDAAFSGSSVQGGAEE
jgi:glycosyltransferase involved in cell wall biosynthesis